MRKMLDKNHNSKWDWTYIVTDALGRFECVTIRDMKQNIDENNTQTKKKKNETSGIVFRYLNRGDKSFHLQKPSKMAPQLCESTVN